MSLRASSKSFVSACLIERLSNVVVTEGSAWDPRLATATLDAALIVNSYHEMTEYRAMLTNLRQALKPGGRLVIVEPISARRRDEPRDLQTKHHEVGAEHVQQEARQAGFRVARLEDPFVKRGGGGPENDDEEWLLVLRPAAPVPEIEQRAFLEAVTAERLLMVVRYVNVKGQTWQYPLWRQMYHVVNHSTYHRGQLTTMLRQLGARPIETDLLVFDDEQESGPA
jgi:SAM-dependent methyltransferase